MLYFKSYFEKTLRYTNAKSCRESCHWDKVKVNTVVQQKEKVCMHVVGPTTCALTSSKYKIKR